MLRSRQTLKLCTLSASQHNKSVLSQIEVLVCYLNSAASLGIIRDSEGVEQKKKKNHHYEYSNVYDFGQWFVKFLYLSDVTFVTKSALLNGSLMWTFWTGSHLWKEPNLFCLFFIQFYTDLSEQMLEKGKVLCTKGYLTNSISLLNCGPRFYLHDNG